LVAGVALFVYTFIVLDRHRSWDEVRLLGGWWPLVLLPGVGWHLARTAGWWVCFPRDRRPAFWRIFRVRLAADGVAYFTIRGAASEPLRVVLLLDRTPAAIAAAASVLERTAMGIISVVGVGLFAALAMSSDLVTPDFQRVFRGIALVALVVLALSLAFLTRTGRYFGPLLAAIHRRTGWGWTHGRVAGFLSEVEALCLELARADRRRIRSIVGLGVLSYLLMAIEVWLVFWAIGQPVSLWAGTIVETFTRSASVPGAIVPGNLGALEASNVAVAQALGLGGGSLAIARRMRSLLWAVMGLVVYPRDTMRAGGGAA
jgi:hypothetical protein